MKYYRFIVTFFVSISFLISNVQVSIAQARMLVPHEEILDKYTSYETNFCNKNARFIQYFVEVEKTTFEQQRFDFLIQLTGISEMSYSPKKVRFSILNGPKLNRAFIFSAQKYLSGQSNMSFVKMVKEEMRSPETRIGVSNVPVLLNDTRRPGIFVSRNSVRPHSVLNPRAVIVFFGVSISL